MNTEARPFGHGLRSTLARVADDGDRRIQPGKAYGLELLILPALLLAMLGLQLLALFMDAPIGWSRGLAAAAIVVVVLYALQVREWLIVPMRQLRAWALQMCSGDLAARIEPPAGGEFARLVFHINRLSDALDRLANDMDDMVTRQTQQLQTRNRSLETLYEVSAALNRPSAVDAMLADAAARLGDIMGAHAALLYFESDGTRHVVDVRDMQPVIDGLEAGALELPSLPGADSIRVSDAIALGDFGWPAAMRRGGTELVGVPISYRGQVLGSVELLTASNAAEPPEHKLLMSVGAHLGMALEKHRSDARNRNLTIMRERNTLAHELHDSLAQTVASLSFQAKMLKESLLEGNMDDALKETQRILGGVDEANVELRELLASFRAPIEKGGLFTVLSELVERNRGRWDARVYFQHEGEEPQLSPTVQLQVMRIVGEAMVNARKHSKAQMLRVLARTDPATGLQVLVEDDGIGMAEKVLGAHAGEHLGLSIMRERAQRAGGELSIESEAEEGTRVELRIPPARVHQEQGVDALA